MGSCRACGYARWRSMPGPAPGAGPRIPTPDRQPLRRAGHALRAPGGRRRRRGRGLALGPPRDGARRRLLGAIPGLLAGMVVGLVAAAGPPSRVGSRPGRAGWAADDQSLPENVYVQFTVDGLGTDADLALRDRIERVLDDELRSFGGGRCSGGDMGPARRPSSWRSATPRAVPRILDALRRESLLRAASSWRRTPAAGTRCGGRRAIAAASRCCETGPPNPGAVSDRPKGRSQVGSMFGEGGADVNRRGERPHSILFVDGGGETPCGGFWRKPRCLSRWLRPLATRGAGGVRPPRSAGPWPPSSWPPPSPRTPRMMGSYAGPAHPAAPAVGVRGVVGRVVAGRGRSGGVRVSGGRVGRLGLGVSLPAVRIRAGGSGRPAVAAGYPCSGRGGFRPPHLDRRTALRASRLE